MSAQNEDAIVIDAVSKSYGERPILRDITLHIRRGEFAVIVGESGGGKSTLLRLIAGLDEEFEGTIVRDTPVAVGFHDARLIPWKRVWENVIFGLDGRKQTLRQRALDALDEVGLRARADVWPNTLSGGEGQRVALARALIRSPRLLLLDEPLGALDALTRLRMQGLIHDLWLRHGLTVLLITHDVDEAALLGDRVIVLSGGAIVTDMAITSDGEHSRTHQGFQEARTQILADLHVDDIESRLTRG